MKKVFLPIFIFTWILVLAGLWIIQSDNSSSSTLEYIFVATIVVFFILGIYLSLQRIKRKKQGFPEEDELSRKIVQKAAATSFYLSLFLWLALIYTQSHVVIDIKYLLSFGMIGMALIFVISWIIFSQKGIVDEK